MAQPPDKIIFLLGPNNEDDDPKITEAVNAALIRLAAQHGITISETGEIAPDARENPERAEKIRDTVTPKLVEFTTTERDIVRAEETTPQGRVKRRVERVGERTRKMSISFAELKTLAESMSEMMVTAKDAVIEIGTKVVSCAGDLLDRVRKK